VQLKAIPQLNRQVEILPVDIASKWLIWQSLQGQIGIFHIVHGNPISQHSLFQALLKGGYELEELAYPEWVDRLSHTPENPLQPLLPLFHDLVRGVRRTEAELSEFQPRVIGKRDDSKFQMSLEIPAIDEKLLQLYLSALGIFPESAQQIDLQFRR
jgi:thioester reductase-like protein